MPGHLGVEGVLQHEPPHFLGQLLWLDAAIPVVLLQLLHHGLEDLLRDVLGEGGHSRYNHLQQGWQLFGKARHLEQRAEGAGLRKRAERDQKQKRMGAV